MAHEAWEDQRVQQEQQRIIKAYEAKLAATPWHGMVQEYADAIHETFQELKKDIKANPIRYGATAAEYAPGLYGATATIGNYAEKVYAGRSTLGEAVREGVTDVAMAAVGAKTFKGVKKLGGFISRKVMAKVSEKRTIKALKEINQSTPLLEKPVLIKHHLFNKFRGESAKSQKYRDFLKKHRINLDEYTVEIPETFHRNKIHAANKNWTTRWKTWIDNNPNASTKEVYQFAGKLMDEYGIAHVKIQKYR